MRWAFILMTLAACGSSTTTPSSQPDAAPRPAEVRITGDDFVVVAHLTVKLTATTTNGSDAAYDWASSDPAVATVASDGTVTGVKTGKATISATGQTTKAAGAYNIVVSEDVPFLADWAGSAHANLGDEPFKHWNATMPPQIPADCARCHSTPGFRD